MQNPGALSSIMSPYQRRSANIPGMTMPTFPNPRRTGQVMFPAPVIPGQTPGGSVQPPITSPEPVIPDITAPAP